MPPTPKLINKYASDPKNHNHEPKLETKKETCEISDGRKEEEPQRVKAKLWPKIQIFNQFATSRIFDKVRQQQRPALCMYTFNNDKRYLNLIYWM